MSIPGFKDDTLEEIDALLDAGMTVEVRKTEVVPHSNDAYITFPNTDTGVMKCKILETAVLYVDMRRSTELSLEHKPHTVAKLYSAFVRSMTRCARYFGGHVRGIIGDRVMVIFDSENAVTNAVNTAQLMNSVIKYQLDEKFKQNDVRCGIGIDYGRILVAKTGIRRNGHESHNYKSLVWLGRPANIASKLTDLAHKSTVTKQTTVVEALQGYPSGLVFLPEISPEEFLKRLSPTYLSNAITHSDPRFRAFHTLSPSKYESTPPILMSKVVYDRYRADNSDDDTIKQGWYKRVSGVDIAGYSGDVFGGDVIYVTFKPSS